MQNILYILTKHGKVPALTGESLSQPLTDSLEISYFLCRRFFPRLLGGAREPAATSLLSKLHSIPALSLSVAPEYCMNFLPFPAVDALLADPAISAEYRGALELKKSLYVRIDDDCLSSVMYRY